MKNRTDNLFTEEQITEIYSKYSYAYHAYEKALNAFTALVPPENSVFEIGIGTGAFTELLLSRGYTVHGIDRSAAMLQRTSKHIRTLAEQYDLLDYNSPQQYPVAVSYSGGFTFKREKFETYYQNRDDLEHALQKIHGILQPEGRLFVNKGEHAAKINFRNDVTFTTTQEDTELTTTQEDTEHFRIYTYIFQQENDEIIRSQKRLVLTPAELQEASSLYFTWLFDHEHWIIGERI